MAARKVARVKKPGRKRRNGKVFRFVVVVRVKGRNCKAKIFKERG